MASTTLALRDARIYPAPGVPPIERGTILLRGGRIAAVGAGVSVPADAEILSAEGRIVTAGFWNAHVHFTEPKWRQAAHQPPAALNGHLREMLTSRGFTTVVDTGSDPRVTLPLRRRIESGEVAGPAIYTAGPSVFPPKGIPYYLQGSLPFWLRYFVPQPTTPAAAARIVARNLARGADLLKLFTGSYVAPGKVATMPEPIARAAVEVAHARGQLVFSHPSNLAGTRIAIGAGVDVLAHPPDTTEGVDASVLRQMVDRGISLTPTLQMFARTVSTSPKYLDPIYEVVRSFRALGGRLLFGTDVGFMTEYATEDEFRALARAGLDAEAVLTALTTAPAQRFGVGADRGAVAAGMRGDLVLLDGDPMDDIVSFARVHATVRAGRLIYRRE
jgi:imidazolonepropionase-like amidohydrolase